MERRHASTLLELIVVVSVIAVLAGLLLSAVQKVRGAAARLSCQNNMRQVNLAAAQHHDALGSLPYFTASYSRNFDYPILGWLPRLLPFVEQDNAWAELVEDFRLHPSVFGKTHRNFGRVIPVYTCPADRRVATSWKLPALGVTWPISFTSYLGNAGTAGKRRDGVITHNSRTRLITISDGTSNTLLFGERRHPPIWFLAGGTPVTALRSTSACSTSH